MSITFEVRRKYHCLYEPKKEPENMADWDLIYVLYEDLDGYIHYEYCGDGTQQRYKMTGLQLNSKYKRM